jgi:serine/threonine protein kinase
MSILARSASPFTMIDKEGDQYLNCFILLKHSNSVALACEVVLTVFYERWSMNAKEIAIEALKLDASERAFYIQQACGGDQALLAETQAILEAETSARTETFSTDLLQSIPDSFVGSYKMIRGLGEGGVGVVYHAQQTQPIHRDVALKVIKPGMDSKEVMTRFESERQALAMMDHPNIARIFDAGSTPNGRPYFVMELVDGISITQYCNSKRLTVKERIELFIPVCKAIHHAHQKGIIHRDIKPSNILVAEQEGQPVPKVIDFGLAKALGHKLSDATMMTNLGSVVGTLEYLSPEQAELTRQDIDTRSDVYSLGVVLYEMLSGTTPLDYRRTAKKGYIEILQRIRTEEPAHLSACVRASSMSVDIAAQRRSDTSRLSKILRGELDWIARKALEKDRARRYETVNSLIRDLERYLRGEAIEAGPPSTVYRLRKFAGRHRLGLSMAAAFILLLVVGVVMISWMAVRASRAEAEARAVNEFLRNDVLAQASSTTQARPDIKPDPDLKVRTALDRASTRIEGKFGAQPLLEAAIRKTIGQTYEDLSLYRDAELHFRRAYELRRRILGESHPDTLDSMGNLATILERKGEFADAEALYTKVLTMQRRVLGEQHPTTLRSMHGLAAVYGGQGKYANAEEVYMRLLELQRRVLGDEDFLTLMTMGNLAAIYHFQAKYTQAEPVYEEALEIMRRVLGEEHPSTLTVMVNLAELYSDQDKDAQAEPLFTKVLEIQRRILGENDRYTIYTMNTLARLYWKRGEFTRSETLLSQALKAGRQVLGNQHPYTLDSMTYLARTYASKDEYTKAIDLYTDAVESRRRVLGEEHPDTLFIRVSLGNILLKQKKYIEAETSLRTTLKLYEDSQSDAWARYYCLSLLGASLADQKKFAEAESLLLSAYENLVQRQHQISAENRSVLAESVDHLITLYKDWQKPEKVAEWRQKLQLN